MCRYLSTNEYCLVVKIFSIKYNEKSFRDYLVNLVRFIADILNWHSLLQETDSMELVKDSVKEHLMVDAIATTAVTTGEIVAATRFISVGKKMIQKTTWCPLLTCHHQEMTWCPVLTCHHQETTWCPVLICHQETTWCPVLTCHQVSISISFYFLFRKNNFLTCRTYV